MKRQFSDPQLNFLVGINVLILVAATVLSHGDFLDVYNFQSMASQLPELALLAIGVSLAMIAGNGGIDLSGLGMANLAGVVAATVVPLLVDADATPWGYTGTFVLVAPGHGPAGWSAQRLADRRRGPDAHPVHPGHAADFHRRRRCIEQGFQRAPGQRRADVDDRQ